MIKILPLSLLLLSLTACQNPARAWIGTWEGKDEELVTPQMKAQNPVIAETLTLVRLTIKADRTFELIRGGIPSEGHVSLGSNQATLTITKILDRPIEQQPQAIQNANKPITLKLTEKGNIELEDPSDFVDKPTILRRKP
jgi:hypothetical protein